MNEFYILLKADMLLMQFAVVGSIEMNSAALAGGDELQVCQSGECEKAAGVSSGRCC